MKPVTMIIAAAASAALTVACVPQGTSAVALAAARTRPQPRLCTQYWHRNVGAAGHGYTIRNDYFGGADPAQCLTIRHGGANFTVTRSRAHGLGYRVQAYPNIFYGWEYGVPSPRTRLPVRVSRLRRPVTSWRIRDHAPGIWNAGYDLWLTRRKETGGKADGAELMIWLGARRVAFSSRRIVRIDGREWYYASWPERRSLGSWQYIQFRRVRPVRRVTHLRLAPFLRFAEASGDMSRAWWLESVEAGFEIWRGGRGLATRSFSLSLGRGARHA